MAVTMGQGASKPETTSPTIQAAKEPFMGIVRELTRAYQVFSAYSDTHARQLGLTPPQFDVIATLGNTKGMTMNRLGEKTLVTKGTLTGIVDRLEQKGLVRREVPEKNRRSFLVVLTSTGEELFEEVFPVHIAHLKERFAQLSPQEMEEVCVALRRLRSLF
ncbi:MarR family winged helix-turn-helix transcriptional regulator [Anthocerotibacter panamensis]|uniref:MarR family winged helix-turn-helix transcriptional regulator n=1 Tax=Anthocerotibacter panamensis TaxID=2857077 RepID=UPI001FD8944A|nr:MarR family transcriptional regulator [Anthocerotibacter panamensis]